MIEAGIILCMFFFVYAFVEKTSAIEARISALESKERKP